MATDYDAPRKSEEELSEDSLQELQARRSDKSSGVVDEDETEAAEGFELPGADLSGEELSVRVRQLFVRLRQIMRLPFEVLLAEVLQSVVLPVLIEEMFLAVLGLLEEKEGRRVLHYSSRRIRRTSAMTRSTWMRFPVRGIVGTRAGPK
jgi:hypothetical protein